jgi:hypothetical protein
MNQHDISDRRIRLKYKHNAGQRECAIHNELGIVGVSPGILRVKAIAQERSQRPPSPTIPNWPAIGFPEDGKDSGNVAQPVAQQPWEQTQSGIGGGELAYQPQANTQSPGWNSQQQSTDWNYQLQANTQSTGWKSQPQTTNWNSHQQANTQSTGWKSQPQTNDWNSHQQPSQLNTWNPPPQAYTQSTGWNSHQQFGQPNSWIPPPQTNTQSTGWNAQPQTNNQPTDGNSQALAESSLGTQQPGGWDSTVSI